MKRISGMILAVLSTATVLALPEPEITGPWQFTLENESFTVPEPDLVKVTDEAYDNWPIYSEIGGWNDGIALYGLYAVGCSLADALDPASMTVKLSDGTVLERGTDYDFTDKWATCGRLPGGRIDADTPLLVSYIYRPMRLDTVVRDSNGNLNYRKGVPKVSCPRPPELKAGEQRLMNIYVDALTRELSRENFYPILADKLTAPNASAQQELLPAVMKKLREGGKLRILAWGDSVTDGSYLPEAERWQSQFVKRLRDRYPEVEIELISNGWSGRTIPDFLRQKPGEAYNFEETVIGVKPDLVVSEFVNDAGLPPEEWERVFPAVENAFRANDIEWVILTPHYVRPDWMGLTAQNGAAIESDPRPYVAFLRRFAADHEIALADAAWFYGRAWRLGIPYNTLMTNNINHPDREGMAFFADALMAIFE